MLYCILCCGDVVEMFCAMFVCVWMCTSWGLRAFLMRDVPARCVRLCVVVKHVEHAHYNSTE